VFTGNTNNFRAEDFTFSYFANPNQAGTNVSFTLRDGLPYFDGQSFFDAIEKQSQSRP